MTRRIRLSIILKSDAVSQEEMVALGRKYLDRFYDEINEDANGSGGADPTRVEAEEIFIAAE